LEMNWLDVERGSLRKTTDDLLEKLWAILRDELIPFTGNSEMGTREFTTAIGRGIGRMGPTLAANFQIPEPSLRLFCTDAAKSNSEYIADFCWTTYPADRCFEQADLRGCSDTPYEIILAAESEQGIYGNLPRTYRAVLYDFVKLLDVKSRVKIMVYRVPHNNVETGFERLRDAFTEILRRHRWFSRDESWLFIGHPWAQGGFEDPRTHARVYCVEETQNGRTLEVPHWAPRR
jgi:hypothetical protein